jgi:hypothetical protein
LIPRVALKDSKDTVTIKNGNQNSLLVFNTSTLSDVVPGYYYWFDKRWNRILASSDSITVGRGNVVYNTGDVNNPNDDFFSYVDAAGASQEIEITSMVKANERVTTLVADAKAVYTYTNEKGDKVSIDVRGDVANNFQDILNNTSVQNVLNEYIVNNAVGNVSYDTVNNTFTYVDAAGASKVIDITSMVKAAETVTTLVATAKAVYTYTNEKGDQVSIDVPSDVANNFQDILNNTSVQNVLNEYIVNNAVGNVSYDTVNNTFTYVDAAGASKVIDITSMVKAAETVTTLVAAAKAVYTYTNEKDDKVSIDVAES